MQKIRIGTRKSKLALVQTDIVKEKIQQYFPECEIEIVKISTKGDEILDRSLASFGGKGVFTKELEEALLEERIDMAVHSAKDMPMEFREGLFIGAVLERAPVNDILVTRTGVKAENLPVGSIIGTSSLRRELQIKEINPGLKVSVLRGNVQTRLQKLKEGEYDGIILAEAGLLRLDLLDSREFYFEELPADRFLPAAGQGILAVEAKKGAFLEILSAIHSKEAELQLKAERSFLEGIAGSCNAPAAAYCQIGNQELHMRVMYAADAKKKRIADKKIKLTSDFIQNRENAKRLGLQLAAQVKNGMVYLVGAGPGDISLASKKALELVRTADVIVYDNLISASFSNEIRDDAEFIYAGKRASNHHLKQEEINRLLIQQALEGNMVVRLKGGDPFIFGRGAEEAEALKEAGIPFEIVPGISSSYAVPAYAGIPVTYRNLASSLHIVTGHEGIHKEKDCIDYHILAQEEGTLVFLMGLSNLKKIAYELISRGKPPKTPAAVIQKGTTSAQRSVSGTLENIAQLVEAEGIQAPAIIVIGDVVSVQPALEWYGKKPLSGIRVLVTGTKKLAGEFGQELAGAGAEPLNCSLIRTERLRTPALKETMKRIKEFTWLVFTSSNGVDAFFEFMIENNMDIRVLAHLKIAVIGSGTEKALGARGIRPDCIPAAFSSADLAEKLIRQLNKNDFVLLLRAKEASEELPGRLLQNNIAFVDLPLYKTVYDRRKEELLNREAVNTDYITFASSSAVKAFSELVSDNVREVLSNKSKRKPKVICIGSVTAKEAVKQGILVDKTAEEYTSKGMFEAIRELHESERR